MRVILSFAILSIDTDGEEVNRIIQNNSHIEKLVKIFEDYNNKYPLITYSENTLIKMVKDIETLVLQCLNKFKLKRYWMIYDTCTIFKVINSKIHQLNNNERPIDRDQMSHMFSNIFNEYYQKGLLKRSNFDHNINEDFLCLHISILEKGKPVAILDPGEVFGKNIINKGCWNFISRMKQEEYHDIYEEDDCEDYDDYHPFDDDDI